MTATEPCDCHLSLPFRDRPSVPHDPHYGPQSCECQCHPDCGPITAREGGQHAHANEDGTCWHEDE